MNSHIGSPAVKRRSSVFKPARNLLLFVFAWKVGFPPDQFLPPDHPEWPGHWETPPVAWHALGVGVDGPDALAQARLALVEMPEALRQVILLRDVEGRTPDEVREALRLSPEDERAMLHQARGLVRTRLERHLEGRGKGA